MRPRQPARQPSAVSMATAVGRSLAEAGVRCAFGVVGGGNIMAVAGMVAGGVRYVPARHEGGAATMADAYHRATGEVAVCTATHGAGTSNLATGLAEAVRHGSGVLLLCGDAPTSGTRRFDIDQAAMVASLGADVVRLTNPATAGRDVVDALEQARAGPVVAFVPNDLSSSELASRPPGDPAAPALPPEPTTRRGHGPIEPDRQDVDALADLLADADRPLLLAGLGAWRSAAGPMIEELAERCGALLGTTVMANGLFGSNPWCLGICGGFSSPGAAKLVGEADVVVAFGASLDPFTLRHGTLLSPDAVVAQVDRCAPTAERVDRAVRGDAAVVARVVRDALAERGVRPSPWRSLSAERPADVGRTHECDEDRSTGERIDPRTLSAALADILPTERTLVLDGGHFVGWPAGYWPVPDPAGMLFMGSAFQAVGLGLAGAVGATVARPDRTTVVALGDGGSLMGLSELETLVRVASSAAVVVYDDAAYGFEVHRYGPYGAAPGTTQFGDTDFAGVARALGATAHVVRRVDDLAAARAWFAAGGRGTLLLDCKIVRDVVADYVSELPPPR